MSGVESAEGDDGVVLGPVVLVHVRGEHKLDVGSDGAGGHEEAVCDDHAVGVAGVPDIDVDVREQVPVVFETVWLPVNIDAVGQLKDVFAPKTKAVRARVVAQGEPLVKDLRVKRPWPPRELVDGQSGKRMCEGGR